MRRFPGVFGLAAVGVSVALVVPTAPVSAGGGPPSSHVRVVSAVPPGQSGFFTASGQAQYELTGDPGVFGPHADDQREMYWSNDFANAGFTKAGTPEQPQPGVSIYRDARGVPSVYGATAADTWWGAGYAIAQDRLFEMDAIRRTARGTLAALAGSGSVPDDVMTRVLTYSTKEYRQQFRDLPAAARTAVSSYVDGANAWREHAIATPSDLPAEYTVLTTMPAPFTNVDVLASGVYMTRYVASQGGTEMANVATLRQLEKKYGRRDGRGVFNDLFWQEDRKGVTTVPRSAGVFDNVDTPKDKRAHVFNVLADYARTLSPKLANGVGTGAYSLSSSAAGVSGTPNALTARIAAGVRHLIDWGYGLHGGSYAYAVRPKRTKNGTTLLESAPQLDYSYPSLLAELEVHGGGYDARGATVPMLPVVGIGHNKHVAWALTTGYSKTVDSFIESTRPSPKASGPRQYKHNGRWHDERCHVETVDYRAAPQGVPTGPPSQHVDVNVCRTVHGPIVATAGRRARSVQYAMWKRELDTIKGVFGFMRARGVHEFAKAAAKVTWNENVTMADDKGNIGYWHPGLFPRRSPRADQRFPVPGTGRYDWRGLRSFTQMPHVINPKRGWVANWNNKPAVGWSSGDLSIAGGYADHVRVIADMLRHAHGLTVADLRRIDRNVGNSDARARDLLPPLLSLRHSSSHLTAKERHVLRLLAHWNRRAAGPGTGGGPGTARAGTDAPAPTIFETYVRTLRRVLFGRLPAPVFERAGAVGSHLYEPTPLDILALRVLRPRTSALTTTRSYLRGHTRAHALHAALAHAITRLTKRFDTGKVDAWRRPHPRSDVCSLTGVVGPCLTMPYEDRGTYIHLAELG